MCVKTLFVTLNVIMFGISVIVGSYTLGVLKDNRRVAFVNVPADHQIVTGNQDYLTALVTMNEPTAVQLKQKR